MDPIASRIAKVKAVTISTPARPMDHRKLGSERPDWQLPTVALEICIGGLDLANGTTLPHEHIVFGLDPEILDAIQTARETLPEVVTG